MDEFEIDITDLLEECTKEASKQPKFEDVLDLSQALDRKVYLGEIANGTGVYFDTFIRFWNQQDEKNNIPVDKRKPIIIYIDSCGGSLIDTFTIIDSIKMSKTPVYTVALGCCYSGGFFTMTAGHKRYAYPNASFLFHEGATSSGGTSSQFANYAIFYKKQLERLKKIVLENTKISEEKYKEIKNEDYWMDAEEALELGVIDEITKEYIK